MNSMLSLLIIVFLPQLFMPQHNAQMRLLKAQIQILRTRIATQRIILSPEEKAELLRIGAECGHEIDGLLEVAKPAPYKRWLTRMRPFKAVGVMTIQGASGQWPIGAAQSPQPSVTPTRQAGHQVDGSRPRPRHA